MEYQYAIFNGSCYTWLENNDYSTIQDHWWRSRGIVWKRYVCKDRGVTVVIQRPLTIVDIYDLLNGFRKIKPQNRSQSESIWKLQDRQVQKVQKLNPNETGIKKHIQSSLTLVSWCVRFQAKIRSQLFFITRQNTSVILNGK